MAAFTSRVETPSASVAGRFRGLASAGLAAVVFAFAAPAANAEVILGIGDSYNVSANIRIGLLGADLVRADLVSPVGVVAVAPGPASLVANAVDADLSLGSLGPLGGDLLRLSAGELISTASSNVDGIAESALTTASSTASGLSLDVVAGLVGIPFLSVTADTITTTTEVSGGYGALNWAGDTVFENLSIRILGIEVASISGSVAANTEIDVASILEGVGGGVRIFLNEQYGVYGDAAVSHSTNAIHIVLNDVDVAGVGTLNGSIVISDTSAQQVTTPSAVPEPASAALMGVGVAAAALFARRRRLAARS